MNITIRVDCKGPNTACRMAASLGRMVHIIPPPKSVVLNTYHYATEEEARNALKVAEATAPTVRNDADLAMCRAAGLSYRLPIGWTDPSMRRLSDQGYPRCVCGHPLCFMERTMSTCPVCDSKIHPYLLLDDHFRPTDPSIPVGFIPMNNGLVLRMTP